MTCNVTEHVIPPEDEQYLSESWVLKEQIRLTNGVLRQNRSYFVREYRQQTAYLLLSSNGEEEVVAFAVIHDDGYLSLLGVAPEHRRQRLGTRLMARLVDDYDTITLHTRATNEAAIEFYTQAGFTVPRRISEYYQDGTDAVFLRFDADASE
jgi:ribosomal protein S18 acetylase RimI-like enzyme